MLTLGILLLLPGLSLQQQCSSDGNLYDLGEVECILVTPYYNQYQWATCLTDVYIRTKSNQQYKCRLGGPVCWYQCMVELYDADQGTVKDGCRCSPGDQAPTTDRLPTECYSPNGRDCSWYHNCLKMRYPCEGTNDGYAIEYAEKFWNLYSDNYNDFSAKGKAWIDGVRKCLQVALVPSLRPWVSKTCGDSLIEAFDSHPGCYINPGSGVTGICELPCLDIWRAFWLVNSPTEGNALLSAPIEIGKQMLSVIWGCTSAPLSLCNPSIQTAVVLGVAIPVVGYGIRLITSTGIVRGIAKTLDWVQKGFSWFSFLDDDSDSGNQRKQQLTNEYTSIKVLLVDAKALNITNGSMSSPTQGQNLNQVIQNLANAVSNGLLSEIPVVLNDTQMTFKVHSVGQCTDILCNSTNITELATAPPSSAVQASALLQYIAAICIMVAYMLM